MNIFLRFTLLAMCCTSVALADDHPEYAAKNIPPDMLKHANTVMREYSMDIDILALSEVDIKEHYVITILNEKGDRFADHAEHFSKLESIQDLGGYVYDANGKKVTKIKESDFKEYPVSLDANFITDDKVKLYKVNYRNYPYTVEYTIETKQNHTFYLPYWSPMEDEHCALQSGALTVTTHGNTGLKYKQFQFDAAPAIITGDSKQYKWALKDVHAQRTEPMSYTGNFTTPVVMLAVNDFMLDDYKGNSGSWKDFGAFLYQLNKGRDVLPADVRAKVRQLVANVTDDHEKIKILYAYLQKNMRYVALEYGIGGWQTIDAEFLCKNQYGDCKALSNFMMAVLEAAGIKAYVVLINAGRENDNKLVKDFVCSQANHAILCVPLAKDTTWLECTSSDLPANYLSDFTQDRDALMITPEGGVLVHTPVYDTSVNLVTRHASVTCNEDGTIKIQIASSYKGEAADYLSYWLKNYNDHDKDEFLHSKFHLPSYNLVDYKYNKIDTASITSLYENTTLTATGMYTKTGNHSFLSLDIAPIPVPIPDVDEERKTQFQLPVSNAVCDTFEVTIPDKYDIEYIPSPVSLRYPFGSYSFSIVQKDTKLIATCRYTINSGIYEPGQFKDYIKLVTLVNNKSNKKVVLKSKA